MRVYRFIIINWFLVCIKNLYIVVLFPDHNNFRSVKPITFSCKAGYIGLCLLQVKFEYFDTGMCRTFAHSVGLDIPVDKMDLVFYTGYSLVYVY